MISDHYRLTVFLPLCLAAMVATAEEKYIFGWVEQVLVGEAGDLLEAKLDTGATTSSIDARNIDRFRRGSQRYVRFELATAAVGGGSVIERPLVRVVRIKQHDGQYQRRPVVALDICLGRIRRTVEFSLVDRRNFDQPVLLGRNALAGAVLVDSNLSHTIRPGCELEPASS